MNTRKKVLSKIVEEKHSFDKMDEPYNIEKEYGIDNDHFIISAIHQHESAIGIHMSLPF